ELDQSELRIVFDLLGIRPRRRLIPADAGDPRLVLAEYAGERLYLANVAAGVRVAIPQFFAMLRRLLFRRLQRLHLNEIEPVSFRDSVSCLIRFPEMKICVQVENVRAGTDLLQHI